MDTPTSNGQQHIKAFRMQNSGLFAGKGYAIWSFDGTNSQTGRTDRIFINQHTWVSLEKSNVPDGAYVQLYFDLTGGGNHASGTWFIFDMSVDAYASYDVYGQTDPQFGYNIKSFSMDDSTQLEQTSEGEQTTT